jgi:hypothetical protein
MTAGFQARFFWIAASKEFWEGSDGALRFILRLAFEAALRIDLAAAFRLFIENLLPFKKPTTATLGVRWRLFLAMNLRRCSVPMRT